jgi:hypothetical protein
MRPHPWPGRSDTGSVLLPVPVPPPPEVLALPEGMFERKHEFHLTLLSSREAAQLATQLLETRWRAAFEQLDWSFALMTRRSLLAERHAEGNRLSVIAWAQCPALNAFRARLAEEGGVELPATLPHVTLYTAGSRRGIGLASMADFRQHCIRDLDLA